MNNILDRYNNIDDIKKMNEQELNIFSDEIRKFLIEKTAKTGGHLASNLGVVELTLSLYKTFDFNKDKLIWDVGHQSYIHKILTGRKNSFDNLRQYGGISGFPKREESKYDIFNVGHSSTSISAALGIARGRDLSGDNYDIISVIGDGALTSGMALEALNDLGYSKNKVLIILNDNQMSIDKNVGGLSLYLSKIRLDPKYNKMKRDLNGLIRKIPTVGKGVANSIEKLKDGVKQILIPGMFFEDIGIKYLGPVDGHDIKKMCEVFEKTKHINGPIVIHVVTKKGKGYKFAENKPDKFHGIGPFNPCTGETLKKSSMTYSKAFGETMIEIAEKNKKVIGITAAMPDGTGLREFSQKFKNRYFDVGIAEEHAVTMAAGLAVSGYKPVFAVYSTFLQRAYDQIVHDVCMQKLPVIFAVDRAGIVGHDGETHQGIFDISYLSHIPNIVIMTPKCIDELKYMLNWAVEQKYPIAIRYPRGKDDSRVAMSPLKNIKLGKWEVLCNGGNITILATGNMVQKAILVKEILDKEGIECTIVNACFIKPLDKELIYSLIKSQNIIVTLEDNILKGGFGSYILEYANTLNLPYNILTLGYEDRFISHGDVKELYKMNGLDEEGICKKILKFKHKIENGEEK